MISNSVPGNSSVTVYLLELLNDSVYSTSNNPCTEDDLKQGMQNYK
jgi:hypothetical protein